MPALSGGTVPARARDGVHVARSRELLGELRHGGGERAGLQLRGWWTWRRQCRSSVGTRDSGRHHFWADPLHQFRPRRHAQHGFCGRLRHAAARQNRDLPGHRRRSSDSGAGDARRWRGPCPDLHDRLLGSRRIPDAHCHSRYADLHGIVRRLEPRCPSRGTRPGLWVLRERRYVHPTKLWIQHLCGRQHGWAERAYLRSVAVRWTAVCCQRERLALGRRDQRQSHGVRRGRRR